MMVRIDLILANSASPRSSPVWGGGGGSGVQMAIFSVQL